MKKIDIKMMCKIAIVAALYVVLTLGIAPLSYGDWQFRLSEVLVLLVLFRKEYAISMILGCFIANCFSPLGWVDMVFGTLATALAVIPMMFVKNKYVASLFPTISNGLIVGAELSILYEIPFFIVVCQVAVCEFVVVTIIGIPIMNAISKNEHLAQLLGFEVSSEEGNTFERFFDVKTSLSLALTFISIMLFFLLHSIANGENQFTLVDFYQTWYVWLTFAIPFVIFFVNKYVSNIVGFVVSLILAIIGIVPLILLGVNNTGSFANVYYYVAFLPLILMVVVKAFASFKKSSGKMTSETLKAE